MAISDFPLTTEESAHWQAPDTITHLLNNAQTIAIVGCSADPARDSHRVAAYLQNAGYRVIPVAPRGGTILGETVQPGLGSITEPVDIVDCFRPSPELAGIVSAAIACNATAVWFQLGLFDRAAARAAQSAGLTVIVDRCTKIEHAARR